MQERVLHIDQGRIIRGRTTILRDIQLDMVPGEFLYLIGKTGAGKSSLIKALYGEWPWESGAVQIAGFNLVGLPKKRIHKLRRKLGIIFQDFFLLRERTVYENLEFVLQATGWRFRKERNIRIAKVLDETGLSAYGFRYPAELSGGEQQRLAIARALLNEPRLLLADEPAGNLDPQTSDEITRLIRNLARHHQTAVLFATHDYRLIERFPSPILHCADGVLTRVDRLPQSTEGT
ncbi:MAG: ATP-binding cassette domain-containing protein [Saprospiraceae bacterium]|nr:ATP-binding cassette domain-containing protein [Saprospiraceae bacterium]